MAKVEASLDESFEISSMDLIGQKKLDECLAECCDKLDFEGICKAIGSQEAR